MLIFWWLSEIYAIRKMPAKETAQKPIATFDDVEKLVFCGKCRKHIVKTDETESLGVALDYEVKWHR